MALFYGTGVSADRSFTLWEKVFLTIFADCRWAIFAPVTLTR